MSVSVSTDESDSEGGKCSPPSIVRSLNSWFLLCFTRWRDFKWMIINTNSQKFKHWLFITPWLLLRNPEPSPNSRVSSHRRGGSACTKAPPGKWRWFFASERRHLQVSVHYSVCYPGTNASLPRRISVESLRHVDGIYFCTSHRWRRNI